MVWCKNCAMGEDCIGYNNKSKDCCNYLPTRLDGSVRHTFAVEEQMGNQREELIKIVKELGYTEENGFRILSPEEHKKLVKGKKIRFR